MFSVFYFPLLGTPTAEGNELTFYEAGTDVPLDVFTDSDGLIPWSQPIVFNAAGEPDGVIYVDPDGPAIKAVYVDDTGVAIPGYPVDFIPPGEILNVTTVSTTTLTDAQIKALPITPITLVTAPASGLRPKPLAATYRLISSAGGYTNINTTYAFLGLFAGTTMAGAPVLDNGIVNDNTVPVTPLADLTAFLGAGGNFLYDLSIPETTAIATTTGGSREWVITAAPQGNTSGYNAAALSIGIDNNGSGALTGGNAANSLLVTVYYVLESV